MPGMGKPFPRLNLAGRTFGRLTVLKLSHDVLDRHGNTLWDCRCACGGVLVGVRGKALNSGGTLSCGCLQRERSRVHNAQMKRIRLEEAKARCKRVLAIKERS